MSGLFFSHAGLKSFVNIVLHTLMSFTGLLLLFPLGLFVFVMFSSFLLSYVVLLFSRLFAQCKGIQISKSGIHCMESRVQEAYVPPVVFGRPLSFPFSSYEKYVLNWVSFCLMALLF